MAHNAAYTKVYVDTANDIGLGIHEIAKCLGRNTLDLGTLCEDADVIEDGEIIDAGGKVNKWALKKPLRFPSKRFVLTDADRASVDFGFDTGTGKGLAERGGASALATLMNAIVASGGASWIYLPPRGENYPIQGQNEWYRQEDFDGYNYLAKAPFRVASPGITIDEPVSGYRDSVIRVTDDVEIDITQMKAFVMPDSESGQMNLACVVRNAGIDRIFILNDSDPFADSAEVSIPIDLRDGVNYCQFIYTDLDPSEVEAGGIISAEAGDDYNFIALPDCFQTFTVSAITRAILMNAGWAVGAAEYFFKVQLLPDGYVSTITPRVVYVNTSGEDVYVQVHASFRYREEETLQSDSANVIAYEDPEDNHIEMSSVNVGNFVGGSDFLIEDLEDVEVKLWWTWGTKRRYFNFATNQIVASDPGYMTLERFFTTQN